MDSGYPLQNYQPQPTEYAPAPQNFKSEDPLSDKPQDGYGYTPISEPQKQTSNSAIVVSSQPTPTIATNIRRDVGDHYLALSIVLTVLCFICGPWVALFCTASAIAFSIQARDAEARGDIEGAQRNSRLSLGCNIGGVVTGLIAIAMVIVWISLNVVHSRSSSSIHTCSHYYNYQYSSYTYSCK